MTPALQLEILDLRHFSAASLRPLLEAEARLWSERLEWDYRPSANLLLQYLDSRVCPVMLRSKTGAFPATSSAFTKTTKESSETSSPFRRNTLTRQPQISSPSSSKASSSCCRTPRHRPHRIATPPASARRAFTPVSDSRIQHPQAALHAPRSPVRAPYPETFATARL